MNQSQFDAATKGTGAIYLPKSTLPRFELMGISVITGNVNNRIRVLVYDEKGQPAFGAWVRHSFGSDFEHFQFQGDAVQFNLGAGSHYSVPDDPPDHITIEQVSNEVSDEVRVGNANLIGFAHTDWQMSFQLVKTEPTPPPSDFVTRQEFEAYKQKMRDANA